MSFFMKIEKSILKFIWNLKELYVAKTFLRKNKAGWYKLPDFNIYHKAKVIKTIWYQHKNRQTNATDRELRNKPLRTW